MSLPKLYSGLITGLAVTGALSFVFMTFTIVINVILRNTGQHPIQATTALIEYALLFATMAGAPWLVRQGGHIAITSFTNFLPPVMRTALRRTVLITSAAILALLSWRATLLTVQMWERGTYDIRSIAIPSWILYAFLAAGFGLMALEFFRLLIRGDIYSGENAQH
ncbi:MULTISPECIES: TRAP transporter small permease [unclassified Pseudovibrio]|uniref:TRAP transporter small permease n=1 Tax=unclassified Pseudovibrio TaxID=2627060 RepID=UPI0007AE4CA6|nr:MULTISPECIES: TRAP transporter small permease [unclassified Pseudovibrio]KZL00552.1 Tripartite ATP-independent periplasmic transporter, DctQ component [Pseudovibrio sp. W74]KZL07727.1 Tripartite ATP-independent periplasmic transporter, DctQ component [Pseudovibrio sp. Ad14]